GTTTSLVLVCFRTRAVWLIIVKSHYTFQSSYRIQNYFSSDCTVDYAVYSGCSVWKFKMVHSLRHSFSSYACYNVCHYYCTFETHEMAGVHRLFVDNDYFRVYPCSAFFEFLVNRFMAKRVHG